MCLFVPYSGDYANALVYYEKGISSQPQVRVLLQGVFGWLNLICTCMTTLMQDIDHNESCNAGIARMAIRTGNVRRLVVMDGFA